MRIRPLAGRFAPATIATIPTTAASTPRMVQRETASDGFSRNHPRSTASRSSAVLKAGTDVPNFSSSSGSM